MNANMPAESSGKPVQTSGTLPAELTSFAARKEARARELAAKFKAELPPAVWAYFTAATRGSWPEVERLGEEVRNLPAPPENRRPGPAVVSQVWAGVMETYMAFAQFALGEPKYAFAFARGIIQSIPPGSIYFGGTDAGRGLVTALCRSHETGDPFFTLTQNALVDRTYLRYLREIYSGSIFTPSDDDLRQAIDEYSRDLERRRKENRLIPGEKVERVDGKVQLTGQISAMAVNGAMARLIFDRNPGREFFVEESFPLDWMYPHLVPHGFILAIAREPLPAVPPERVEEDRRFWQERLGQMLGDWLRPETPLSEVCAFAEKVFLRQDLAGFAGDPKYVASAPACQNFSKLRRSIAGLYSWRARNDPDPAGQRRMAEAAEFAFRQAFALDPRSPGAVFGLAQHLLGERRPADAFLAAETASKMAPENSQVQSLTRWLAPKDRKEQR